MIEQRLIINLMNSAKVEEQRIMICEIKREKKKCYDWNKLEFKVEN